MENYIKILAIALITVILIQILSKKGQDISVLLSITVCSMILMAMLPFLDRIFDFVRKIQAIIHMDPENISILFKAVGIGLLTEIVSLICADGGNGALCKTVQLVGTAVILWLSIPVFTSLLDLVISVLGAI